MNLNYYGSGCRCLLRLRENLGNPIISDQSFITSHLAKFPDWQERPGVAGLERLLDLAEELGISFGGMLVTEYNQVLSEHRAGKVILIRTEPALQESSGLENCISYSVLLDMDESKLTRWRPTRDGFSDTMRETRAKFWTGESASALVLTPAEVIPSRS